MCCVRSWLGVCLYIPLLLGSCLSLPSGAGLPTFHDRNSPTGLEGRVWGPDGPPPPLKDLGIMLLGGLLPPSADWIVGLFLYFLIAMGE